PCGASLELSGRPLRGRPQVEEVRLQGEVMIVGPVSSRFFVLNRTMTFVWRRCDGAHRVAEMVDELRHEFAEVDPATAEGDLKRALGELVSLGLVVYLP